MLKYFYFANYRLLLVLVVLLLAGLSLYYFTYLSLPVEINKSTSFNQVHNDGKYKKIGKMVYDPEKILGRGSLGTTVYQGTFDKRACAIKRIMKEHFELAEKEVDLLRSYDNHDNVIRYFISEHSEEFTFIALELCECTLQQYIEDKLYDTWRETTGRLEILEALFQSMAGLVHLHESGVCHRDIKPSNILIASRSRTNDRRIVLSDFGLSKQIPEGAMSFSFKSNSGFAGTNGWIAPEILERFIQLHELQSTPEHRMTPTKLNIKPSLRKVTQSVDIFSLGCVFYYGLTSRHPYGNTFTRQANILQGAHTCKSLIVLMNPTCEPEKHVEEKDRKYLKFKVNDSVSLSNSHEGYTQCAIFRRPKKLILLFFEKVTSKPVLTGGLTPRDSICLEKLKVP